MKFRVLCILALVLAVGPAFAQKVYIDHDTNYDFGSVKTFAWAPTPETSVESSNPLLHSRIVADITKYMIEGGLSEVQDNPDIYVTYHGSSKEEMSISTSSFGYGYPGGWGYGGYGYGGYHGYGWGGSMGTSTSTVSTYEVGTLIVDAWDADSKELVWRGTAGGIMITENATKMSKRIDKALQKIVKKSRQTCEKAERMRQKG